MPTSDEDAALDVERLLRDTFVAHVESHEELASTNDLALARAAESELPCPLLIVAQRQTAGRGRGTNRWWADGGALTFSLVLETEAMGLPQSAWPRASLVTGLAVCETIREMLPSERPGLKWPNDVFLRERKLCGVLVETSRSTRPRLVVGVGINVNNRFDSAPEEIRQRAISLSEAASRRFDLTDVLSSVLQAFAKCYADVTAADSQLPGRWTSACMLRGRRVTLNVGSRVVVGICQGIDAEGALVLASADGEERFFGGTVEAFSALLP